jgi:hypothetical protein
MNARDRIRTCEPVRAPALKAGALPFCHPGINDRRNIGLKSFLLSNRSKTIFIAIAFILTKAALAIAALYT